MIDPHHAPTGTAYATAPSIVQEICLIAEASGSGPSDVSGDREFRLRKAALLDCIAVQERARYGVAASADADDAAEVAAEWLVEYDVAHSGLSRKGRDLVLAEEYRDYVRAEYEAWSRSQAV
ncbi:hypothetical protein [Streptomyces colonosanans]|uniref:Uncharacterized protein n=1 Tax=Streptomyces colonosanans TaxID=1428652 RepID=A0A1S2P8I3_9ACTN|nr:hypothetical protein [Streptomyces colonosanans]OIJ89765.1 hypothetical protein BIV24_19290 [Streptomyces colonosanans]